jgi:tetratricopeptide (TPR) repeat protein
MRERGKLQIHRASLAAVVALCLAAIGAPARADSVKTTISAGYGRALFTFDPPAKPVATVKDGVLTIHFDRKVALAPADVARGLTPYISAARADTDGKTFRFGLAQPVRLHSSVSGDKYALDLIPAGFAGTPPNLPPPPKPKPKAVDVASLPALAIRAGAYENFTRLVFDWHRHVAYAVFPGSNRITIRFEAEVRPDFRVLDRIAPPWVKRAGWRIENGGTVIDFNTESQSGYHDFRDGDHVVLDILAPKTDAAAYNPPSNGRPKKKPVVHMKADAHAAPTADAKQARAIAATAEKLNHKPATPKPAPAANDKPARAKPTQTKTSPPAPKTRAAHIHRTSQGASLTFPGAAAHGVAAFVRGMTAWIVLDGSHAIDPKVLKTALGDFPASLDASSGNGVSVLRIGLKRAEQIAVRTEGTALKVALAPKAGAQVTGIEFARDGDDPKHPALVTLLPGATHAVTLSDPVAGDTLIVVPGFAGRAVLDERRYVDFSLLRSASGLAIAPFADGVKALVHDSRVRITKPDGLTLTASQSPQAQSLSALARNRGGPCYIDFAGWSHPVNGRFLKEERTLRDNAARLDPDKANPARLTLARFYIANEFAAEALGLVNVIQASDPSLQDDMQLQTIRAAADYMMARYRDAYNTLAGSAFDNDRNAALWRGLTEAALEDWGKARKALLKAMPVLDRYPPDWQARARIALADAATHAGALEAADAALGHLPKDMPKPLLLEAELARGRLYAAEGRYRDARVLFAAVKKSGDQRAIAHAIYDDVAAGLAAGAVTPSQAISRLEALRYRWRGDFLELKTLRKLGALYFGQKRWRDGLETLRVAARNFPNSDMARQAQDDMRRAFVRLYLKGAADKMPPIRALALFYDFIALTPIGADGDEMIRRMADRLVKVDLLGPAASLLKYQVDNRLDGVARAQVATRLAMIDLLDHKAKAALAALRSTRIAGLPDNMAHERLLLEARALAALKQWDQALDLIAVDKAPDTRRLRADIYWESGNWAAAGQKIEQLLGKRWEDPKPLTAKDRHDVMRAAIAYSLANDETSLDRLRAHFAAKMKKSSDASAFAVITQRIDTQGVAFRDVAGRIASLDTLESFMKNFKKHYSGAAATN